MTEVPGFWGKTFLISQNKNIFSPFHSQNALEICSDWTLWPAWSSLKPASRHTRILQG